MPSRAPDVITTRSGLSIPKVPVVKSTPGKPNRIEKATPRKKKERIKAPKRVEKLLKPLSELARDYPDVLVADIGAYVHRTAAVRQREVEESKIPGKIKRPMNAFMLYRKAYQNLAKILCTQNNHQVVSQVCGDGWPLEPDQIREQFNDWAKVERTNHQNAHPGYKFTPAKPRKKKDELEDSDDASTLGDLDWGSRGGRSKSSRLSQHAVESPSSIFSQPYQPLTLPPMAIGMQNPSVYQYTNPGKPLPTPYDQSDLVGGHYYQQSAHQRGNGSGFVEDVMIRKTPSPLLEYSLGPGPVDGGFDLIGHYQSMSPPPAMEHMIDPSLVPQDRGPYDALYSDLALEDQKRWHPQVVLAETRQMPSESLAQYDDGLLDPQLQYLRGGQLGGQSDWHISTFDEEQPPWDLGE